MYEVQSSICTRDVRDGQERVREVIINAIKNYCLHEERAQEVLDREVKIDCDGEML